MEPWSIASDIGERLAELRDALGITSEELAKRAGVWPPQVSNWITKKQKPTKRRLVDWALREGWPIEMFQEGGPRPATVVTRHVSGTPGAPRTPIPRGVMQVGETRYPVAYGAPVRETIDKLDLAALPPEHLAGFAALEVADADHRGQPMDSKRILWWIERAFEAGKRVASATPDPVPAPSTEAVRAAGRAATAAGVGRLRDGSPPDASRPGEAG